MVNVFPLFFPPVFVSPKMYLDNTYQRTVLVCTFSKQCYTHCTLCVIINCIARPITHYIAMSFVLESYEGINTLLYMCEQCYFILAMLSSVCVLQGRGTIDGAYIESYICG